MHERVDLLDDVHREADGARLIGERPRDRLTDPPGGVGRELVAPAVVELLDGAHQAEVALLDQVEQRQDPVHVALGDRDDEAQVGLDELALGVHVAAFDAPGQRDLFHGAEQGHFAERLQIQAHRIAARRLDREIELCREFLFEARRSGCRRFLFEDLDAALAAGGEQLFDLLDAEL